MITEVERLLKQILRRTDIGSHDTTEDLRRDLRHIEQHAREALAALQGGEGAFPDWNKKIPPRVGTY